MITAYGENDVAESAEALGACRVLDKPIDMRDLDAIIRAAACPH
jgi:DNA-binding NtrC family response regulator